jgi:hypothetical protein
LSEVAGSSNSIPDAVEPLRLRSKRSLVEIIGELCIGVIIGKLGRIFVIGTFIENTPGISVFAVCSLSPF